ncbi:MAG: hypothetical protein ACRD3L_09865 [Terriglobales bacterium]
MSFEIVYSFLFDAAVVFLGGWVVFLLAAYTRAFGSGDPPRKG